MSSAVARTVIMGTGKGEVAGGDDRAEDDRDGQGPKRPLPLPEASWVLGGAPRVGGAPAGRRPAGSETLSAQLGLQRQGLRPGSRAPGQSSPESASRSLPLPPKCQTPGACLCPAVRPEVGPRSVQPPGCLLLGGRNHNRETNVLFSRDHFVKIAATLAGPPFASVG